MNPLNTLGEIADAVGGKLTEVGMHPDGESGFAMLSMPLPADHWLYETTEDGYTPPPQFPLLAGKDSKARDYLSRIIDEGVRHGFKSASDNGRLEDIDPDALLQNTGVGLFGYHTPNGLSYNLDGTPDIDNPKLPGDLGEVVLETLKLLILDGLVSVNEVHKAVEDPSIAQALTEWRTRQDQRQREYERWREKHGVAQDVPG
ncbi:hypothetical protein LUCX_235 [Xanthomonas phage vB_XciM_LucasX]|nr:hypothetical protein LUCX_235 [Xanthomonas phage vB_XciM_LucasX]